MPNSCSGCTACCTAFRIDSLGKDAYESCVHCDGGCKIQDSKPYECSSFNCAWIQSNVDNEGLRPDRCGVILEKLDDSTFLATVVKGMRISPIAFRQFDDLVAQGYKVKISDGNV